MACNCSELPEIMIAEVYEEIKASYHKKDLILRKEI